MSDHRVLNKDLHIFFSSEEIGAGLPFWAPRGMNVRLELEKWLLELENAEGYLRLASPPLAPQSLYRRSGHLEFYADGMFPPMEGNLRLRPMNCPHHHVYFASRPRSERELPFRLAEFGQVFRDEPSGSLSGLRRARCFSQNDGHIYVLPEQAFDEIRRVLRLHRRIYDKLGLKDHRWRLSRADFQGANRAKFALEPESWLRAEGILRDALRAEGLEFFEAPGEAAFYGPKIDVQCRSARGAEESIASIQLDFLSGRAFGLEVVRRGGEKDLAWVIHRAPLGSFERFVAFLLERDNGWLPFWLSPDQVAVMSIAGRHADRAAEAAAALRESGVRAILDDRDESLPKKIRGAHRSRIPVIAVIGDKELASGGLSVRERGGLAAEMSLFDFVRRMKGRTRDREA